MSASWAVFVVILLRFVSISSSDVLPQGKVLKGQHHPLLYVCPALSTVDPTGPTLELELCAFVSCAALYPERGLVLLSARVIMCVKGLPC